MPVQQPQYKLATTLVYEYAFLFFIIRVWNTQVFYKLCFVVVVILFLFLPISTHISYIFNRNISVGTQQKKHSRESSCNLTESPTVGLG